MLSPIHPEFRVPGAGFFFLVVVHFYYSNRSNRSELTGHWEVTLVGL